MLRTMANVVNLLVCRPHDENYRKLSPLTAEPPKPPQRSSFNYKHLPQHHHFMQPLESILPPGVSSFLLCECLTIVITDRKNMLLLCNN